MKIKFKKEAFSNMLSQFQSLRGFIIWNSTLEKERYLSMKRTFVCSFEVFFMRLLIA